MRFVMLLRGVDVIDGGETRPNAVAGRCIKFRTNAVIVILFCRCELDVWRNGMCTPILSFTVELSRCMTVAVTIK